MTRKYRRILLVVAALLILAIGGYLGHRWTRPDLEVTYEQVERIQVGMSVSEVEAILGAPAGDHTHGRYTNVLADGIKPGDQVHLAWLTRNGTAFVTLTEDRHVKYAAFCPEAVRRETWYDHLLEKLGY